MHVYKFPKTVKNAFNSRINGAMEEDVFILLRSCDSCKKIYNAAHKIVTMILLMWSEAMKLCEK